MSAKKRALKRAHRDAIRRVQTQAGAERYDQPINSIIRPKSQRPTVTLPEAREQVKERLGAYNPSPSDTRSDAEKLRDFDQKLVSDINWYKNAPTHTLIQHEKVLTDIVDTKVSESGHHKEIPAFQKAKAEAAEAMLDTVRNTLADRPQGRRTPPTPHIGTVDSSGSHVGGAENKANRAAAEQRGRALEKRSRDDELRAMADSAVREKRDRREFTDRMRRLNQEARNRAKAKDRAAAPEVSQKWAIEAAKELDETAAIPRDKVRPSHVQEVRAWVSALAKKRGQPEHEVYASILQAKGHINPGMRKALYAASGTRPPERGEDVPVIEPRSAVTLRPAPKQPKFRDPKTLTRLNDDDLAAYRDEMKGAADSRVLAADQRNRARDAHRAAVAEINRRRRGIRRR
ncbi:hypothetical protein SEA_VANLEE_127 [Gordonia phage VanLee]|uniref:Uncharacterized protein n=1 Tax=Gordonia phage VanLee TaxID=2845816 RepID=A0A8F2D9J0_9CAUD|nr:hypothetical protein QEH49_gp163 [Gordonia phage VanLee]QWS68243.1 hypothetical protein SEA_VANLEE_127 [Gordonia phage VanLee]